MTNRKTYLGENRAGVLLQEKSSVTFEDLIANLTKAREETVKARKELEQQVRFLKDKEELEGREITRLLKLAYFTTLEENPLEWHRVLHDEYTVRRDEWELLTSIYDFKITLYTDERRKRLKYRVKVWAWRRTLSPLEGNINGGFIDYEYGRDAYMRYLGLQQYEHVPGQELEKSFPTILEAHAFVEQWKRRLYEDHKEHIDEDRRLYELCKASGYQYEPDKKLR